LTSAGHSNTKYYGIWLAAKMSDKSEVITFKVDGELKDALNGMKNRSEFIRSALLAALDGTCPFCRGTGILTPRQMEHWTSFSKVHSVTECDDCHGIQIECSPDCGCECGHADQEVKG
jgi:DnaJ-class molecular chaperone